MGTTYDFVCETCKKRYDIGKMHNAQLILPKLLKLHEGHKTVTYSEHDDELKEKYEGDWLDAPKFECEYVNIWDKGKLKDEILNLPGETWEPEEFYKFWDEQKRRKESV